MAFETSFSKKIEHYLAAGFPMLYVTTWEEMRVERALETSAKANERCLWVWSLTQGWTQRLGERGADLKPEQRKSIKQTDGPDVALRTILKGDLPGDSVLVLRDFHAFLENPEALRLLRDLSSLCKAKASTIVFVTPVSKIPIELQKDVVLVDFSLPTREELGVVLDRIVDSVGKSKAWGGAKGDEITALRASLLDAARGLTEIEAENTFAFALVEHGALTRDSIKTVLSEKANIVKKDGTLQFYEVGASLADVGGLDNLKQHVSERKRAFTDEARTYGLPYPRGLGLVGVQGCGKSLSAKAIANEMNVPLLRFDVGRVFGSLIGESEANMRRALSVAEAISPCVLWLDEMEKGTAGMESSGKSDAGVTARVFGEFLSWLAEKKAPVYVIATVNQIDRLPAEMIRKGRFDEWFFVDLPTELERRDIFEIGLREVKRDPRKFNLEAMARAADRFSGAEIKEAIISGMYAAFHKGEEVTTQHVLDAVDATTPLAESMEEQINALRERAKKSKWRDASKVLTTITAGEARRMRTGSGRDPVKG